MILSFIPSLPLLLFPRNLCLHNELNTCRWSDTQQLPHVCEVLNNDAMQSYSVINKKMVIVEEGSPIKIVVVLQNATAEQQERERERGWKVYKEGEWNRRDVPDGSFPIYTHTYILQHWKTS